MKLTVIRFEYTDTYTISKLFIGSEYECYVLEDTVRKEKIPGKTAIPAGLYRLVIDYSPKYNRRLLHILDVPHFEGIRIHSGNDADDTDGCLLVGKTWNGGDKIGQSRDAYLALIVKVSVALDYDEPVFIEILDANRPLVDPT